VGGHTDLPEIPTAPSGLEQITRKLQEGLATANALPIRDVFARLLGVLEAMERLLSSEDLAQGLNAGRRAVDEVGALAHQAAGQVDPLAESLELTLVELRSTLRDTRRMIGTLEPEVAPVADDIRLTLGTIREAARQAEGAFSGMEKLLSEGSPLAYKLDRVLDELVVAVRSLRVTSDYLQQNPNAIFYGKRRMGGN
jgi:paraquat-inducible protein B